MKRNAVSISDTPTIREAAAVFVQNHAGLLPVVSEDGKLVGVAFRVDSDATILSARIKSE